MPTKEAAPAAKGGWAARAELPKRPRPVFAAAAAASGEALAAQVALDRCEGLEVEGPRTSGGPALGVSRGRFFATPFRSSAPSGGVWSAESVFPAASRTRAPPAVLLAVEVRRGSGRGSLMSPWRGRGTPISRGGAISRLSDAQTSRVFTKGGPAVGKGRLKAKVGGVAGRGPRARSAPGLQRTAGIPSAVSVAALGARLDSIRRCAGARALVKVGAFVLEVGALRGPTRSGPGRAGARVSAGRGAGGARVKTRALAAASVSKRGFKTIPLTARLSARVPAVSLIRCSKLSKSSGSSDLTNRRTAQKSWSGGPTSLVLAACRTAWPGPTSARG